MRRFGTKWPSMTSTWCRRTPAPSAPDTDATDAGAAGSPCGGDDGHAVLRAVEALDLPDAGLDAGVLKLVDRVANVARPPRPVIRRFVAVQFFEFRLLRRHEELE